MSRSPIILPANFSVQRSSVQGSGCWPFRWLCNGRAIPCQRLCHLHGQVSLSSVSYSQPSREPGHIYDPHPSSSHAPIIPPLDTSTCCCFQLPSFLWHLAWVTPKLRAHRNELRPDSWNQSVSTSGGFRPHKGRYRLSLWYSNTKVTPPLIGEWSSENVAAMCLYWKKYHWFSPTFGFFSFNRFSLTVKAKHEFLKTVIPDSCSGWRRVHFTGDLFIVPRLEGSK